MLLIYLKICYNSAFIFILETGRSVIFFDMMKNENVVCFIKMKALFIDILSA
jgi:hypothetical protein